MASQKKPTMRNCSISNGMGHYFWRANLKEDIQPFSSNIQLVVKSIIVRMRYNINPECRKSKNLSLDTEFMDLTTNAFWMHFSIMAIIAQKIPKTGMYFLMLEEAKLREHLTTWLTVKDLTTLLDAGLLEERTNFGEESKNWEKFFLKITAIYQKLISFLTITKGLKQQGKLLQRINYGSKSQWLLHAAVI